MGCYYTALPTRSYAFLLEQRMKNAGINCELTFIPRSIMTDVCNLGVKFNETEYHRAVTVLKQSGIPGCKLYREIINPYECTYIEEKF